MIACRSKLAPFPDKTSAKWMNSSPVTLICHGSTNSCMMHSWRRLSFSSLVTVAGERMRIASVARGKCILLLFGKFKVYWLVEGPPLPTYWLIKHDFSFFLLPRRNSWWWAAHENESPVTVIWSQHFEPLHSCWHLPPVESILALSVWLMVGEEYPTCFLLFEI